jgi:hypothetical protein
VQTVDFPAHCRRSVYLRPCGDKPLSIVRHGRRAEAGVNIMAVRRICLVRLSMKFSGRVRYDYEAGAIITGGHSILDEEPSTGWRNGIHPSGQIITNFRAQPATFVFTKPVGSACDPAMKAYMASEEPKRVRPKS